MAQEPLACQNRPLSIGEGMENEERRGGWGEEGKKKKKKKIVNK